MMDDSERKGVENRHTGGIAVGQNKVSIHADKMLSVIYGLEEKLIEDLGETVGTFTAIDTLVRKSHVRFVVGAIKILTVPALGKEKFQAQSVGTRVDEGFLR